MEFIFVSSPTLKAHKKAIGHQLDNAPRLTPLDGPVDFVSTNNVLLAAPNIQHVATQCFVWDGHGVTKNTAFSSGAELPLSPTDTNSYLRACSGTASRSDMRGVFACAVFDTKTSEFSIALDPLSQYPLFIFTLADTLITSNNIYWIEAVAKQLGHAIARNAEAGAIEAAFGIGAGLQTGFEQVSLLPHGHMIAGDGTSWQLKAIQTPNYKKNYSYEQLVKLSASRLRAYMAALEKAAPKGHLLFDLTGGQDSRICFAAALGAGLSDITIFSGGDDQDADKRIAYQIAEKFGAKIGNYPENYDGQSMSMKQSAQTAVFRQQGHSNLYHYELGNVRLAGVCRVRGGAGELARSFKEFPSKHNLFWATPWRHLKLLLRGDSVYREALRNYWDATPSFFHKVASRWAYKYCSAPQSYHRLFQKPFLKSATCSVYSDLVASAETPETMGMDLYLKDRAKRHFGYISRGLNMSCGAFEPLYDPVLLAAAEALPPTERAKGRLSFDLIEMLGGKELLGIPFHKESVTQQQLVYLSEKLAQPIEKLRQQPTHLPTIATASIKTGHKRNLDNASDCPEGLGMHGPYLWNNRTYFSELIKMLPASHDCWFIFNKETLTEAAAPDGYFFRNETTVTRGLRIFHTLLWVAGEELQSAVDSRI